MPLSRYSFVFVCLFATHCICSGCQLLVYPGLSVIYPGVSVYSGCQLLVYPGAFNMTTGPAHWELLARARAVDNQCYVATVSPARDVSASYVAWGHSLVVNPWYAHKL